ncbi:AraC family transcriptional regulator [Gangjinia marincola]
MSLVLKKNNVVNIVKNVATDLGGTFTKEFGSATVRLDNEKGQGFIKAYEMFPGLGAIIYNITFNEPFQFTLSKSPVDPLYFIFCLEGQFKHRFGKNGAYTDLDRKRNVILKSGHDEVNEVVIPADTPLKISVISVLEDRMQHLKNTDRSILGTYLEEIFTEISNDKPYRFLGKIRISTANYVRIIMDHQKKGVVGRLLAESSILNILASQLDYHDQETEAERLNYPIKESELERVVDLGEFVASRINKPISIEDLKRESGLSPKKLQLGFRYLYDRSINGYISNVRIEKARQLIEETDLTISEIVYSCGLSSRSYFSKIFKEKYGINPSEYKKQLKTVRTDSE